jgi:hypothetical protein
MKACTFCVSVLFLIRDAPQLSVSANENISIRHGNDAFIRSPPIELVATYSNFGLAPSTNTSAFRLAT